MDRNDSSQIGDSGRTHMPFGSLRCSGVGTQILLEINFDEVSDGRPSSRSVSERDSFKRSRSYLCDAYRVLR